MTISYEDSMTCLECWGDRQQTKAFYSLASSNQMQHQLNISHKTSKLSLKRPKDTEKSHDGLFYHLSYKYNNQKWLPPQTNFLQPSAIYPPTTCQIKIRPRSTLNQNKEAKVTFDHRNSVPVNSVIFNSKVPKTQIEEKRLDQTAKISKAFQKNQCELQQTKKFIPSSRFSLQELSHLKQSVFSIIQGEEKSKIQESTIMMNYFNPSTSRLMDFKLNSKLFQSTSVCSQKQR